MNVIRLLTLDDEAACLDFVLSRLGGWLLVMGRRNSQGHRDGRFRETKEADRLLHDTLLHLPPRRAILRAFARNEPVHLLWPDHLQDHVERFLISPVPDATHEPTSAEYRDFKREFEPGWTLPPFLAMYGSGAA